MASTRRRNTVQSLERGLDILEALSTADRQLGITDLSRSLGLAKGSIARLVATFVKTGYLARDPRTAKYRLGMKIFEVGHRAVAGMDLRDVAQPVMERLHAATQETVHLTVLTDDGYMVFLDKLDSTKATRPNIQLGAHLPPYCVANGKAVLAFRPEAEVERILGGPLQRFTMTTLTQRPVLSAALEGVRRLGYAVNHGEFRPDVSGVAAPILDYTELAVAALGVSVPTSRMTPEVADELARLLVEGARVISRALGQRPGGEAETKSENSGSPEGPVANGIAERR